MQLGEASLSSYSPVLGWSILKQTSKQDSKQKQKYPHMRSLNCCKYLQYCKYWHSAVQQIILLFKSCGNTFGTQIVYWVQSIDILCQLSRNSKIYIKHVFAHPKLCTIYTVNAFKFNGLLFQFCRWSRQCVEISLLVLQEWRRYGFAILKRKFVRW